MWVDLRADETRPRARFGVQLTDTLPEEQKRLAKYLEQRAQRYRGGG